MWKARPFEEMFEVVSDEAAFCTLFNSQLQADEVAKVLNQLAAANERVKELEAETHRRSEEAMRVCKKCSQLPDKAGMCLCSYKGEKPEWTNRTFGTDADLESQLAAAMERESFLKDDIASLHGRIKHLRERAERAESKNTKLLAAFEAVRAENVAWRAAYDVWNNSDNPRAHMRDCEDSNTDAALRELEGE